MKKIISIAICLVFISASVYGASTKQRLQSIEERLQIIEEVLEQMVQATIPTDLDIYQDVSDPTELGDIRITGALTEIDDCDVYTTWTVHQGTGIMIVQETGDKVEGTGSVKITFPTGQYAIVHAEFAAKDLSGNNLIRCNIKTDNTVGFYPRAYIGEDDTLGNWQDLGVKFIDPLVWNDLTWNISAVSDANKDAVIRFALGVQNNTGSSRYLKIDFARAYKYGQVKAIVPDGVIQLFPKFYVGTYVGTGDDNLQINIPRKGTPSAILILKGGGTDNAGVIWTSTMTAGNSQQIEGGTILTTGIKSVGDCYFTLGTYARVNSAYQMHFIAMWAD